MSTIQTLEQVTARKQRIVQGDPDRLQKQRKDGKLTARERIDKLLDPKSFVELGALVAKDGQAEGVVTGFGTLSGRPVCLFSQDFTVAAGSMSGLMAQKILKVVEMARKTGAPLIALCDSAGARIGEGALALDAYAQVFAQIARLSGVVPMVALVLGPCVGGAAMLTQLVDFAVMPRKVGQLMTHGPQVVAATYHAGWTAEQIGGADVIQASGGAAFIEDDEAACFAKVQKLLTLLPSNNLEDAPLNAGEDLNRALPTFAPGADAGPIIASLLDQGSFVEVFAGYTHAVAGFGKMGGHTVAVLAPNGKSLCPRASAKLARVIRFADCYNLPVVSLIDTDGFEVLEPEHQVAMLRTSSQLMYAYAEATTLKLSVVTGKAIGAAYVALGGKANADVSYAWPGAVIAPLSPEAAVQVLYKDELAAGKGDVDQARKDLADRYAGEVADGVRAAEAGLLDDVIDPADTRKLLIANLEMLSAKRDVNPPKKHGNLPL